MKKNPEDTQIFSFECDVMPRLTDYIQEIIEKDILKGHDLYLMSEFDIEQCKEIKGNAVILTDKNTAYFIIDGKIIIKDGKPQAVEGINRQGIKFSDSIGPTKYTDSEQEKEKKVIIESTLKRGYTHPRQETLDRLKKHGGFCSAFSLLILTSTLLSKIPKKGSGESKTVRDDYETISHLFELVARRRNIFNRDEEAECDAACERIINYIFSIQILVDDLKEEKGILLADSKDAKLAYYQALQMSFSDNKQEPKTYQPLSLEFQVTGYANESNLKKYLDFIPEDRIYSINMHNDNADFKDSGHAVAILKTQENNSTVYYFVDQNAENIRIKLTNLDEVAERILQAAEDVEFGDKVLINCKSLVFNAPGMENKPFEYPEKTELLQEVCVPGKEVDCVTFALNHQDTESADIIIKMKKSEEPGIMEKLNDQGEDFEEDILPCIFPKLSLLPPNNDIYSCYEKFLTEAVIGNLNSILMEIKSPIRFETDSGTKGKVNILHLTRESLKEIVNLPKFNRIIALTKGETGHSSEKASAASAKSLSSKSSYSAYFLKSIGTSKKENVETPAQINRSGFNK